MEISPYLQQPGLLDFCKKFDIVVTAYSSLVRGSENPDFVFGDTANIFKDEVLI